MRISTPRAPRWLAASAAWATLGLAAGAQAQYAPQYGAGPYVPAQSHYGAAPAQHPQYGGSPSPYMPHAAQPQSGAPQYATQGAYQGYSVAPGAQPGFTAQPTAPAQNYGPYAVPHMAMNYQAAGGAAPTPAAAPGETLPLTPPAENVSPGPVQHQGGSYQQPAPAPAPASENYGYGYAPGSSYETYPAAGAGQPGCATGNCGTGYGAPCNTAPYGACDTYSTYGGMGGVLSKHAGCGYWFGGVYGLLMDRDNSNKYPLVFAQTSMPVSSYPSATPNVVLTTRDVDVGFQPGVEFRLGRTFGCGPIDPCSCGCATAPRWGLEGVYWTLFDDDATASYVDQGSLRTYTMMPFYGIQYNNGSGYRPMNEYFDHAPPSQTSTDIEVRLARVRSSLEVQNVEINLLRLNVCGGGCGSTYTAACGADACGGCDTGCATGGCDAGYGACSTGYAATAPRLSRYSCTGVCGFRWMQFNEDFMFGVDFDNTGVGFPNPVDGSISYWSTTENNLFGAQIGCNGMYRVGCKWGFHLNTLVGLYGNDIDVRQYFVTPTDQVQFIGTGEDFNSRAYKTDVAMLGELRVGASYQATCRCRLYGGWRAIGVTGIALATDQAPNQFLSAAQMSNYVNSNGSMILHGLQTGVEWNY
ncbi:MAG TPA: hypothetical protein VEQ85_00465 [Lacipirellulaceae bacterium]|nr:hypothetical protein [Lacipirellulaceae bacterium]